MAAAKTEANPVVRIPEQPDLGHLKVYQRTDNLWIVYDTLRPAGDRTAWLSKRGQGLKDAIAVAQKMYDEEKSKV